MAEEDQLINKGYLLTLKGYRDFSNLLNNTCYQPSSSSPSSSVFPWSSVVCCLIQKSKKLYVFYNEKDAEDFLTHYGSSKPQETFGQENQASYPSINASLPNHSSYISSTEPTNTLTNATNMHVSSNTTTITDTSTHLTISWVGPQNPVNMSHSSKHILQVQSTPVFSSYQKTNKFNYKTNNKSVQQQNVYIPNKHQPKVVNASYNAGKMSSTLKSQTLDSRVTPKMMNKFSHSGQHGRTYNESIPGLEHHRRTSNSSGGSEEMVNPTASTSKNVNQSKFANFLSRTHQQIKSNLKRTKSATKLDRKKTGGDSDNDEENIDDGLRRSLSTSRLSRRRIFRLNKPTNKKIVSSEKNSSAMRTSHSHETLLTNSTQNHPNHCLDLSHPFISVYPIHSSVTSDRASFIIRFPKESPSAHHPKSQHSKGGKHRVNFETSKSTKETSHKHTEQEFMLQQQCISLTDELCTSALLHPNYTYYFFRCHSNAVMRQWIYSIKECILNSRKDCCRTDHTLNISIVESKNLITKKRYYCKLHLDKVLYARTSSKPMLEHVFWREQFVFRDLPEVSTISIHLFKEVEKKKKKEKPYKIGEVNISTSSIKNQSMINKWYHVVSPTMTSSGGSRKSGRVEGAGIRIELSYQTVDILPGICYMPLLKYIQSNYKELVEHLNSVISVKAKEGVATCLASVLHSSGNVVQFLSDIVLKEVSAVENTALALRGNSIATKAVESYMKLVGQQYLINTLGDVLQTVIESDINCEVDPVRSNNPATLMQNQQNLIETCTLVWNKIINSKSTFPREMRQLFKLISHNCMQRQMAESLRFQMISSFVFLRFFCPAILYPNLFITQEFPSDRGSRNITLVAKTIQCLANLTHFGSKERFMEFMNDFVSAETQNMQDYLNYISSWNPDGPQLLGPGKGLLIDQFRELSMLHRLLSDCINAEKSCVEFEDLASILKDISNKLAMDSETLQRFLETQRKKSLPPITPTTQVNSIVPLTLQHPNLEDSTILSKNSSSLYISPPSPHNQSNNNYNTIDKFSLTSMQQSDDLLSSNNNLLNQSIRRTALPFETQKLEDDWKSVLSAADASNKHNNLTLVNFNINQNKDNNNATNKRNTNKNVNNALIDSTYVNQKVPLGFQNPSYSAHYTMGHPPYKHPSHQQPLSKYFQHHHYNDASHKKMLGSYDNLKHEQAMVKNNRASINVVGKGRLNSLKTSHRSSSTDSIALCNSSSNRSRNFGTHNDKHSHLFSASISTVHTLQDFCTKNLDESNESNYANNRLDNSPNRNLNPFYGTNRINFNGTYTKNNKLSDTPKLSFFTQLNNKNQRNNEFSTINDKLKTATNENNLKNSNEFSKLPFDLVYLKQQDSRFNNNQYINNNNGSNVTNDISKNDNIKYSTYNVNKNVNVLTGSYGYIETRNPLKKDSTVVFTSGPETQLPYQLQPLSYNNQQPNYDNQAKGPDYPDQLSLKELQVHPSRSLDSSVNKHNKTLLLSSARSVERSPVLQKSSNPSPSSVTQSFQPHFSLEYLHKNPFIKDKNQNHKDTCAKSSLEKRSITNVLDMSNLYKNPLPTTSEQSKATCKTPLSASKSTPLTGVVPLKTTTESFLVTRPSTINLNQHLFKPVNSRYPHPTDETLSPSAINHAKKVLFLTQSSPSPTLSTPSFKYPLEFVKYTQQPSSSVSNVVSSSNISVFINNNNGGGSNGSINMSGVSSSVDSLSKKQNLNGNQPESTFGSRNQKLHKALSNNNNNILNQFHDKNKEGLNKDTRKLSLHNNYNTLSQQKTQQFGLRSNVFSRLLTMSNPPKKSPNTSSSSHSYVPSNPSPLTTMPPLHKSLSSPLKHALHNNNYNAGGSSNAFSNSNNSLTVVDNGREVKSRKCHKDMNKNNENDGNIPEGCNNEPKMFKKANESATKIYNGFISDKPNINEGNSINNNKKKSVATRWNINNAGKEGIKVVNSTTC